MHENGIITAPVSLAGDVATVLGDSSTDLGTLCRSNKINMWALYKPVKHTNIGILSESERKGFDGQIGFDIPWSSLSSCYQYIETIIRDDGAIWSYNRPTGGNYPFRLLDFDKYNHNAIKPFNDNNINYISGITDVLRVISCFNYSAWSKVYNFTPDKLVINNSSCANWYTGVIAVLQSDVNYTIQALVTDSVTLANTKDSNYFDFNCGAMNKGDYYLIPVICSSNRSGSNAYYKITNTPIPSNDIVAFLPVPFSSLSIVSPAEAYVYPKVSVYSNGQITVDIFATNKGDSDIISPTITLTVEYFIGQEDGSSWSEMYKQENSVLERGNMPAGAVDHELTDEYFTISKSYIPSNISLGGNQTMRVTIIGVNPSYLGTTQLEFKYNVGTYTEYTINP